MNTVSGIVDLKKFQYRLFILNYFVLLEKINSMEFKTLEDIVVLIKANHKIPDWVEKAREEHKDLKALVYGDEFKDLILRIEHIESEKKSESRRKYSRSIKDINSKLLEPSSNVFSATGGQKDFPDLTDDQKKTLITAISNVRNGLSMERFLEVNWVKDLYAVDPNGLMFLEYNDTKAYPTYKSICHIRNYKASGINVKWVLFEPKKPKQGSHLIWRFVDDSKDWVIKQDGEIFTEITDVNEKYHSFNHPFGFVPAVVISEKQRLGEEIRFSPLDTVVEIEKEILRDRSILTLHKFLNGFPVPYRPALICPTCKGTKKNENKKCTDCNGSGFLESPDITDQIILPIDINSENSNNQIPSNFAGFIKMDVETWNQYSGEEKRLFNVCFESLWGTRENEVKDQTAMGLILNVQPMISKLHQWSKMAESIEAFFVNCYANFLFPTKAKDKNVCNISYGRNYIIQPPDFLLADYQKSKGAKDDSCILDIKLVEYLTSKFKNNPEALRLELLKKELSFYVHLDFETVDLIFGKTEAMKKGLFIDWFEGLTEADKLKTKDQLIALRDAWMEEKIAKIKTSNPVITQPIGVKTV